MVKEEEWKTCVYDGEVFPNYEVSTRGRVRSLNYKQTGQIKVLKPQNNGRYYQVNLSKNGQQKLLLVHRLVGIAFIPNLDNKPTINHINENTYDNRVENLEWATQKEQNDYGTGTERRAKAKHKRVKCIETGQTYDSMTQASEETGLPLYGISKVCRGQAKSYKGTHWEFVD